MNFLFHFLADPSGLLRQPEGTTSTESDSVYTRLLKIIDIGSSKK